VPLFQEQAMRVSIECAGFTAGEADQLRRAMATFKHTGGVSKFRDKLINGMVANGYTASSPRRPSSSSKVSAATAFPKATPPALR
jgi:error-prone DNA polymerase